MKEVAQKARRLGRRRQASTPGRWAKLNLLATLVRRDLEAQYKGSILGNLWPLLNQLSQLVIYTYVFSIVPQGKAQPCRLPGKQRHYIWSLAVCRFVALECLHQRFDQVGSIGGGAAEFSEKSGISSRFAAASADFYSFY